MTIINIAKKNLGKHYLKQFYDSFVYPYLIYYVEKPGRAKQKYIYSLYKKTMKKV